MALTENVDVPLGTPCPDFRLPRVDGGAFGLADAERVRVLVVMFICNHCPYVQAIEDRYVALARAYEGRGVQVVGICSNDPTDYPDDRPERLLARWREKGYGFPYLIDEAQDVARAFRAVCTPDLYVYDGERRLAYHGRLDDSWKDPSSVKHRELAAAIDALLAGERPAAPQIPSMGCSIKWRKAGVTG
jgi:peroxiredoxin